MDQPNGVCWGKTALSSIVIGRIELQEMLYLHDPAEDINTETEPYVAFLNSLFFSNQHLNYLIH